MVASLEGINEGDWVECEFARPARGLIISQVLSLGDPIRIHLDAGSGDSTVYRVEDFTSITKVKPPQPDEPTGKYAVVEMDGCHYWRSGHWDGEPWVSERHLGYSWDSLVGDGKLIRVVFPGETSNSDYLDY